MKDEKLKIISDICPFYKEYGTCEQCNTELDIDGEPCYFECMANAIINNGYRKQREGHWISKEEAELMDRFDLAYTCSVCGHCDWDCTESENFNFCPNCGAKMKGGSE